MEQITHSPFVVNNGANFSGTLGDSVILPNTSDAFTFHDSAGNDIPFSISFWNKNSETTQNQDAYFWIGNDVNTRQVSISRNTFKVNFQIYTDNNNLLIYEGINASPTTATEHFAVTYDGSKTVGGLKFYYNGVEVGGTATQTGTYTGMNNVTQQTVAIGEIPGNTLYMHEGLIDEFHIWKDRVLTPTEVTDIYNTENAGNSILPALPLLDTYTGAAAAYSLRDLSSSTTNVVRVRRSSDNTEQDFTSTQVTDGTLETFVGAGNDGFVVTWYDQSGNSRNAEQTNTSLQPVIVSSGSLVLLNGMPAIDTEKTLGTNSKYLQTNPSSPFYAVDDASAIVVGAQKTGEQS